MRPPPRLHLSPILWAFQSQGFLTKTDRANSTPVFQLLCRWNVRNLRWRLSAVVPQESAYVDRADSEQEVVRFSMPPSFVEEDVYAKTSMFEGGFVRLSQ